MRRRFQKDSFIFVLYKNDIRPWALNDWIGFILSFEGSTIDDDVRLKTISVLPSQSIVKSTQ